MSTAMFWFKSVTSVLLTHLSLKTVSHSKYKVTIVETAAIIGTN